MERAESVSVCGGEEAIRRFEISATRPSAALDKTRQKVTSRHITTRSLKMQIEME